MPVEIGPVPVEIGPVPVEMGPVRVEIGPVPVEIGLPPDRGPTSRILGPALLPRTAPPSSQPSWSD
ncbi:MAG: hypothetical protein AVDCRST_MAG72-1367 [uncultured Nocardioidaceae bacterium]|uniref:Uncharacterized protein n=1 Tax=uncultured Nocardioidaceae bacterium TaxID=253824 RepID=A0A6J4M498_9ACTN|nr:MAG: hypothetical protein AVDCRST_MAG72-1367 [uncultured Nocardioidaceae bacterium]